MIWDILKFEFKKILKPNYVAAFTIFLGLIIWFEYLDFSHRDPNEISFSNLIFIIWLPFLINVGTFVGGGVKEIASDMEFFLSRPIKRIEIYYAKLLKGLIISTIIMIILIVTWIPKFNYFVAYALFLKFFVLLWMVLLGSGYYTKNTFRVNIKKPSFYRHLFVCMLIAVPLIILFFICNYCIQNSPTSATLINFFPVLVLDCLIILLATALFVRKSYLNAEA